MKLVLIILLVFSPACTAEHGTQDNPKTDYLYGTVVKVIDGDTITILTVEMRQAKIRLAEIDTPERGQPFGKWAKQQLAGMVAGEAVAILFVDIDRYDRVVGRVYVGDLDVNAELVRIGAAWVYDKYASDPTLYELQEEARNAKRGLWSETLPIPPWKWRRL